MEEKYYGTLLYNLKELKKLGGNPLAFEEKVCALKDPELSYWFFTAVKGSNKKVHRQIILDSEDAEYNYEIAKKIQDTCFIFRGRPKRKIIREHGQVVIDSGSLYYNFMFAKNINYADVKAHGCVVITSQDPEYNYKFARYVEGADIKAHGQAVIASQDSKYNYYFARDIKGADVEAHWESIKATSEEKMKQAFVDEVPEMVAKKIASSLDNMIKAQKK